MVGCAHCWSAIRTTAATLAAGRRGSARVGVAEALVRRELRIIRDDLHCTAFRITGGDPRRLELAAAHAADLGLEVWFSPYPLELTTDEMLTLFADCAERAERVRQRGAEVVFVLGAELSLMSKGFLPGDTQDDRLGLLLGRGRLRALVGELSVRVNDFLGTAAALVRERFGGRITYAAIPLERVDWTPFDIVGVDLYRSAEVADQFGESVRTLVAQGKPVAITEFGTAGVDSAFVFLFTLDGFPHRPDGDPRDDLDLASPGIVRVLDNRSGDTYPDLAWEPKAAFRAVAEYYGLSST